jgi:signal transduction histidine kinase
MNLLSNASKFSPPDSVVHVSVTHSDGTARVSVKDTGPGISAMFLPRLFDKFSQGDSSDQRRKGGTGLGLAISRALMQRMGGTIDVTTKEGEGSTFHLDMPLFKQE